MWCFRSGMQPNPPPGAHTRVGCGCCPAAQVLKDRGADPQAGLNTRATASEKTVSTTAWACAASSSSSHRGGGGSSLANWVSGRCCTQVYAVLMKQCGGTIKTREDLQKVMEELKVGWQGGNTHSDARETTPRACTPAAPTHQQQGAGSGASLSLVAANRATNL